MNSLFRNALDPAWLWGFMALVPLAVLALYFLKLKREPLEVPSTYLWNKSIEDLHVNSLWQRLRKSLLLFLQLLLLLLAIFALLRPGWEGARLEGQRFIFLVDNSASMGATDVEIDADGNQTRLAEAKQRVAGLIEQMDSDMSAMLISFSDEARVVQEFTSNRRKLREGLAAIQQTSRTTNLLDALQLADGLANPGQMVEPESNVEIPAGDGEKTALYIFSDGRFADVKGFSLGNLEPQIYAPLGKTESSNLAITALSTRRNENRPEERQAFTQVSNFSEQEQKAVVELSLDGQFRDAREVAVPPGESRGVTFTLSGVTQGMLTAKLSGDSARAAGDVLAIDNSAYAEINDTATGRVLFVSPGNLVLSTALATERAARLANIEFAEPAILESKEHLELADSGAYDLIIYDQCVPQRMPRSNTLFIGRLPPVAEWKDEPTADETTAAGDSTQEAPPPTASRVSRPQIIDYSREHPLLAYVELGDIYIVTSNIVKPPRGGAALIDSTDGPIFSIAPREGFEDAVLGFEILVTEGGGQQINTNWYNRLSFPTFILNTLDYFVSADQEGVAQTNLPGRALTLRTKSLAKELVVAGPTGARRSVARNDDGSYLYHDTEVPGHYDILAGDEVVSRFAVNLFDGQESNVAIAIAADDDPNDNIESAASLQIGHVEVAAEASTPARKDLWRPLLMGAIAVLLFEWYVYNRRVYL